MPQTVITTDTAKYYSMLNDTTLDIRCVNFVGEEKVAITYKTKEEFIIPSGRTNVVIAAMTTAHARMVLYEALEKLGSDRTLYFDTDSVIYISKPGDWEMETSSYLGGWTDELGQGETIKTFLCGGPKNYAYELSSGKRVVKCKGIKTKLVHFDNLCGFIDGTGPSYVNVERPLKIVRRNNELFNVKEVKKYRMVYTKRKILADGVSTRPFGYSE